MFEFKILYLKLFLILETRINWWQLSDSKIHRELKMGWEFGKI